MSGRERAEQRGRDSTDLSYYYYFSGGVGYTLVTFSLSLSLTLTLSSHSRLVSFSLLLYSLTLSLSEWNVINLNWVLFLIARVMASAADSERDTCSSGNSFDARAPIQRDTSGAQCSPGRHAHIGQSPSGNDRLTCQSRQVLA